MGFFDVIGNMIKSSQDNMFNNKVREYRRIPGHEIEELIPSINNGLEKICAITAIADQGDFRTAVSLAKNNNISKDMLTRFATHQRWGEVIRRMIKEYDDHYYF